MFGNNRCPCCGRGTGCVAIIGKCYECQQTHCQWGFCRNLKAENDKFCKYHRHIETILEEAKEKEKKPPTATEVNPW